MPRLLDVLDDDLKAQVAAPEPEDNVTDADLERAAEQGKASLIPQEGDEISSAADDHNFNELQFAASNPDDQDAQDLAFQVHKARAKNDFKDKAGAPFKHYKPSMTLGDVASGFGSFVRGTAMAVPRLLNQAVKSATDNPNAATITAENVIGAQMAGKNLENMLGGVKSPAQSPEPVVKTAKAMLLNEDGTPNIEEIEKWEKHADKLPVLPAMGEEPEMNLRDPIKVALARLKSGDPATSKEEEDLLDYLKLNFAHPEAKEKVDASWEEEGLKRSFFDRVKDTRESMQLESGVPLNEGVVADLIRSRADGDAPSDLLGPQGLKDIGAEPVDIGAAHGVAAASDVANVALMKVPSLPGMGKVGGAIAAGTGKVLEGAGLGAKVVPKLARRLTAGAGIYALANGDPATATTIAGGLAAVYGLRKIGALGNFLTQAGKEAMTGAPSANTAALAAARRAGRFAPGLTAKNMTAQAIIGAASMPVGAAPLNLALSKGDSETFWAMTAGSPLFGVFGAFEGIKPQLVNAIRPQLRQEGKTRFEGLATDKWGKKSKDFVETLPEDQRNSVYEISAVMAGLATKGKNAKGEDVSGVSEIIPLSAADYAAMKAENGLGTGDDRGVAMINGKAYINAESAAHTGEGGGFQFAHTAGHEMGGHVGMSILRAMTGKGGPLYDAMIGSARKELGTTKDGVFTPSKQFKQFIDGYNAAIKKGGQPVDVNRIDHVEEFIAETAGRIFSMKGAGEIAIPDGIRDRISNGIGRMFGKSLGVGGQSNFGHEESAKITALTLDALRQIADPNVRRITRADSPEVEKETPSPEDAAPEVAPAQPDPRNDARLALIELGWPKSEAAAAVKAAQGADAGEIVANVLKGVTTPPVAPPAAPAAPKPEQTAPAPVVEPAPTATEQAAPEAGATGLEGFGAPNPASTNEVKMQNEGGNLATFELPKTREPAVAPPERSAEEISREARDRTIDDLNRQLGKPTRKSSEVRKLVEQAAAEAQASPEYAKKRNDKTKAQHIKNARVEAILKAGEGETGTTLRRQVDKYGDTVTHGEFDPKNPIHKALAEEVGLRPEQVKVMLDVQKERGNTIYIDYNSAKVEEATERTGEQRAKEQTAEGQKAADRREGAEGVEQNKAFVPFRVQFNAGKTSGKPTFTIMGFSPDRLIANVQRVQAAMKAAGIESPLGEGKVAELVQAVAQNHANGYKGDGSAPVTTEGTTASPATFNASYKPTIIPADQFNVINMAMANERTTGATKKASSAAKQEEALQLATLNDTLLSTGEVNPLRQQLKDAGFDTKKTLEPTIEVINPENIIRIHGTQEPLPIGVGEVRPAGAGRSAVAEAGLPRADFTASGFMPDVVLEKTDVGKNPEDVKSGGNFWLSPDGKFYGVGDHGNWAADRLSMAIGEKWPETISERRHGIETLKSKGWIRISRERETSSDAMFLEGNKPTPKQASALEIWKEQIPDWEIIATGPLDKYRQSYFMPEGDLSGFNINENTPAERERGNVSAKGTQEDSETRPVARQARPEAVPEDQGSPVRQIEIEGKKADSGLIYDLNDDPLGLIDAAADKLGGDTDGIVEEVENQIREHGYAGFTDGAESAFVHDFDGDVTSASFAKSHPQFASRVPEMMGLVRKYVPEFNKIPADYWHAKPADREQVAKQNQIAREYEQLKIDNLNDPEVANAYEKLTDKLRDQYEDVLGDVDVEPWADLQSDGSWKSRDGQPYKTSREMQSDLRKGHLYVFTTAPDSFGSRGQYSEQHPLLADSGFQTKAGYKMLYNDVLRAVHDAIAHGAFGIQFGPHGEEAAWRAHMATIDDPAARQALTTETRGQNSWVNFRDEYVRNGEPIKKGEEGYVPPTERPFADQKTDLLDRKWALTGDPSVDAIMQEKGGGLADFMPFAGKTAKGFKEAEKSGRTFTGKFDKKERFEISDKGMKLKDIPEEVRNGNRATRLSQIIDHPELFENYPKLKDLPVRFDDLGPVADGTRGQFEGKLNPRTGELTRGSQIVLNKKFPLSDRLVSIALHEIQHGIQAYEGFAEGGSPDGVAWAHESEQIGELSQFDSRPEIKKLRTEIQKIDKAREKNRDEMRDLPWEPWGDKTKHEASLKRREELDREHDALNKQYKKLANEYERAKPSRKKLSKDEAFERYRALPGEQEAREAEERRMMTDEERAAKPPRLADFMPDAAYSVDWAERHNLKKTEDGKFVLYHATPKDSKFESLREGSLLATTPKDAEFYAMRDRDKPNGRPMTAKDVKVIRVELSPEEFNGSVFASTIGEIPIAKFRTHTRSRSNANFPADFMPADWTARFDELSKKEEEVGGFDKLTKAEQDELDALHQKAIQEHGSLAEFDSAQAGAKNAKPVSDLSGFMPDAKLEDRKYDPTKSVDVLMYSPELKRLKAFSNEEQVVDRENVEPDQLAEYVGKDFAEKLLATEQKEYRPDDSSTKMAKFHRLAESAKIKVEGIEPQTEAGRKLRDEGMLLDIQGKGGIYRIQFKTGEKTAGTIEIQQFTGDNEAAILGVIVSPEFQKRGIGEALYREAGAWLQNRGVDTVEGDAIAKAPMKLRRKVFGEPEAITDGGLERFSTLDDAMEGMPEKFTDFVEYYDKSKESDTEPPKRMMRNRITPDMQFMPEGGDLSLFSDTQANRDRSRYVKQRAAEQERKYPEALPVQYKRKDGKVVIKNGRPEAEKIEYDLQNTPLAKKAAKGVRGEEERHEAVAKAYAEKLRDFVKSHAGDAEIEAGKTWYQDYRNHAQKLLGEDADLFAQLLAATSARTPVHDNFKQALDALENFKEGKYDDAIKKYTKLEASMDAGELQFRKSIDGNKPGDVVTPKTFKAYLDSENLLPRKSNDAKFNANSMQVLQALAGVWLDRVEGPKTPQFYGNLTGKSNFATVDVWAARTIYRLGNEGMKDRWRILPEAETGVNDADFALAQRAYKIAADELGMNPDDLQGMAWFAEKTLHKKRGWTRGAGGENSDFRSLMDRTKRKDGRLKLDESDPDQLELSGFSL